MEVRPGYKKTEIGIIPEEWEVKSYGDIFTFLNTASYPREKLSFAGDIKYIHYGDIHTKWVHHLDVSNELIPSIKTDLLKNYPLLRDGDVILVDASEDYAGICKSIEIKNICTQKAISGLHTYLLRDKGVFVNGYRGYLYLITTVKRQFNRVAVGLKVYGVNRADLKNVLIPVPPKDEQKIIAQYLSEIDSLISSLEKLIVKKKLIKQGVMQELLTGKRRLPGFTGEWETKRLGEIAGRKTTGKLDANAMKENGEYRFYTCAKEFYYIDIYAFEGEALLVSGNGAYVGYIHYYDGRFNAYQRTYVIMDISEDIFFVKLFMDVYLKERIETEVNLGNTPYIKMDTLTDMEIRLPPTKQEQNAIAQVNRDIDSEISILNQQLSKYKLLNQGIMEELLTGRIRLV